MCVVTVLWFRLFLYTDCLCLTICIVLCIMMCYYVALILFDHLIRIVFENIFVFFDCYLFVLIVLIVYVFRVVVCQANENCSQWKHFPLYWRREVWGICFRPLHGVGVSCYRAHKLFSSANRLILLVIGPWLVVVTLQLRSGECWRSVLVVSSSCQFVPLYVVAPPPDVRCLGQEAGLNLSLTLAGKPRIYSSSFMMRERQSVSSKEREK